MPTARSIFHYKLIELVSLVRWCTDYLLDLDRLITVLFQQLTTMLDHWDGCSSHQWFSNNWGFGYRYKYLWHAISQSLSFIFQCCTLVFAQKCEKHIVKKGISHNNIYYIYVLVTNSANCFIKPMGIYRGLIIPRSLRYHIFAYRCIMYFTLDLGPENLS